MKKKIIVFAVILSLLIGIPVGSFGIMPARADSGGLYQTNVIGIMPEEYVGAFTLELANTYENDFKSNYSYPMQGMVFTKSGALVICDTSYGRVHVFDKSLVNQFTFGELGKGPGKLQYPADVAVDSDGNFYVADFFNNYWAKFDKIGNWILNAGSEGSGEGELNGPSGIAVSNGKVYVSDQLNGRIAVFTADGKFVKNITVDGLKNPGGMCADPDGNILVVDMSGCTVYKLSPDGQVIASFGSNGTGDGQFVLPFDVYADSKGNIYVVDRGLASTPHPVVEEFDSSGKFIKTFGTRATKFPQPNGSFLTPAGVAVDSDGNVFVIDAGYFHNPGNPFGYPVGVRLTEFSQKGDYLRKVDFSITQKGRLMNPMAADVDSNGNIWVANWGNFSDAGEVDVYTSAGKFVKRITKVNGEGLSAVGGLVSDGKGHIYVGEQNCILELDENGNFVKKIGDGKVSNVMQVTIDGKGNIWAASNGTQTVAVFKSDGTFITQYNTSHAPVGIATDKDGNFYITTTDDNKVYEYDSKGNVVTSFGGNGRSLGKFWIPYGVAVDSSGEILVADTENGRIQAFDKKGKLLWHTERNLYEPVGINIGSDGKVYVADCFHNVVRVLSFEKPEVPEYSFNIISSVSAPLVPPGETVKFNLILSNTGTKDDSYSLNIENKLPSDWQLGEIDNSVTVKTGNRVLIPVTLTVPKTAKPEDTGYFVVKVNSESEASLAKSVTITVTVPKKPPVSISLKADMISVKNPTPVSVNIGLVEDFYGVAMEVDYDPNVLTVEKVVPSEILGEDAVFMENHNKPGVIYVGYTLKGKSSGKTISGELFEVYFQAKETGDSVIFINSPKLVNSSGDSLPVEVTNLTVELVNPVPPKLSVDITDGQIVDDPNFYFNGQTDPGAKVTIDGKPVDVGSDGTFIGNVYLDDGSNTITIVATNKYDLSTTVTKTVILQTQTVITLQPGNPIMTVNGVSQEIDPGRGTKPVIIAKWGRTVVPIRAIVEALGGTIGWDGTERKVTINLNETTIELWIGKPKASVNGEMKWIDEKDHSVKPIIVNGRTMLPLRFVTESLGCKVDWDPATKTITITYKP
jgi:sugar lactone lactonase YvrE